MPRHENPSYFRPPTKEKKSIDLRIKNKFFSARTKKQSQLRYPQWNQVNVDLYTKTKSFSTTHKRKKSIDLRTKNMYFSARTQKQSQLRSPH